MSMVITALNCFVGLWEIYVDCSLANTSQVLSGLQGRTVGFHGCFSTHFKFTNKLGFLLSSCHEVIYGNNVLAAEEITIKGGMLPRCLKRHGAEPRCRNDNMG